MSENIHNNTSINTIFKNIVYYSPLILSFCVIIFSLLYKTFKGVVFFIFIICFTALRSMIISNSNNGSSLDVNAERSAYCNINDPTRSGSGFVVFYTSYLIFYILAPMFIYAKYNFLVMSFLLIYLVVICAINVKDGCMIGGTVVTNMLAAFILVVLSVGLLMMTNNAKLLFVDDLASDATFCSMPSQQSFKCSVYKNGELISSTTTNGPPSGN